MNRGLLVLCLGLLAGAGVHVGYFTWQRPVVVSSSGEALAWMRQELRLSDEQYQRIVSLHRDNGNRLEALSKEVRRMRDEYNGFEQRRLSADQVDFIAFAKFIETRRTLDKNCNESARSLVHETLALLDGNQRTRFLTLLAAGGGEWLAQ